MSFFGRGTEHIDVEVHVGWYVDRLRSRLISPAQGKSIFVYNLIAMAKPFYFREVRSAVLCGKQPAIVGLHAHIACLIVLFCDGVDFSSDDDTTVVRREDQFNPGLKDKGSQGLYNKTGRETGHTSDQLLQI